MLPKLRCRESELAEIARRYKGTEGEADLLDLRTEVVDRGWMRRDELRRLAHWKAPRSAGRVETNPAGYVREITAFAFHASTERARVEVLTTLDGVQWPTASVILHFFHREPYPIIDYRALWSVCLPKPPQYDFDFWWTYVQFCRQLHERTQLEMRTLDRALWQYSKENQP